MSVVGAGRLMENVSITWKAIGWLALVTSTDYIFSYLPLELHGQNRAVYEIQAILLLELYSF